MSNSGTLRERINDALAVIARGTGDAYDMARKLGLPTFSEFEAAVAPLLKRVALDERTVLLEKLYVVTAQKLMKQNGKRSMEYMM